MTLIKLHLDRHEKPKLGWRAGLGIELSQWCQEHGLIRDQDYDWAFMSNRKELHFRFFGEDPEFVSFFTLRWAEYL